MRISIGKFFLFMGVLYIASHNPTAMGADLEAVATEISGPKLRAGSIALIEFGKQSFLLENYNIYIVEKDELYEVIFVPKIPLGEELRRGGSNSNGKEIHYWVTNTGKIEKITYAR